MEAYLTSIGVPDLFQDMTIIPKQMATKRTSLLEDYFSSFDKRVIFVLGPISKLKHTLMMSIVHYIIRPNGKRRIKSAAWIDKYTPSQLEPPLGNVVALVGTTEVQDKARPAVKELIYSCVYAGSTLIIDCESMQAFEESFGKSMMDYLSNIALAIDVDSPQAHMHMY